MKYAQDITHLIGNTPIVKLNKINSTTAYIFAKLESFNPMSSVKDRVALSMIVEAERIGKLNEKSVIIEPTSGNTGIGLAFIGASRGYQVILTMPDTMSIERRTLLKALGAKIILTDGKKGMTGAIEKATELVASTPHAFMPQQFENLANPKAHFETTAQEIWNDMDGKIDFLVSAVGTGGTLTGIGSYLKQKNPTIKIIAVEPETSAVLSGNPAGAHKIQGIGAGFIPKILDTDLIDEIIQVSDENAGLMARNCATTEGVLIGISSGAALFAALEIAKRSENKDKNIIVIFPDSGERYLSTWLFNEA